MPERRKQENAKKKKCWKLTPPGRSVFGTVGVGLTTVALSLSLLHGTTNKQLSVTSNETPPPAPYRLSSQALSQSESHIPSHDLYQVSRLDAGMLSELARVRRAITEHKSFAEISRGGGLELLQTSNEKETEAAIAKAAAEAQAAEEARVERENRITYINGSDDSELLGQCAEFIADFEGCSLTPYSLAGQWLIGYGHADGVTRHSSTITPEKALAYFKTDIKQYALDLDPYVVVAKGKPERIQDVFLQQFDEATQAPAKDENQNDTNRIIVGDDAYKAIVDLYYNGNYKTRQALIAHVMGGDVDHLCHYFTACRNDNYGRPILAKRRDAGVKLIRSQEAPTP